MLRRSIFNLTGRGYSISSRWLFGMSVFLRIDSLSPSYHKSEWEITFAGDMEMSISYLARLSTITEDNPANHVFTRGGESWGFGMLVMRGR